MLNWINPEKRSVNQLCHGELEGLRWIYENHAERLLNQAYRILLSEDHAKDMVQDLFLKLSGIIIDFRGQSGLGTWLFRVMHNMCLKQVEQSKNRLRLESQNIDELAPGALGSDYEAKDLLGKAMSVLDPETRSLLWLKEGEGVSLKELAMTFQLPEGTLKSRLSRARERVREYLEKEEGIETV